MATDPSSDTREIAGFWRRLGAFCLDGLLLAAMGLTAGVFLSDLFVRLGPAGRLVGFTVALVYFGTLNSRWAGGQTPGKRLLKIKVVSVFGASLPLHTSFLRFLPLGAAWFLNGAQLSEAVLMSFWGYAVSVAVFGLGLSIVYLFIFNRRTRQSLHDLLVGSCVVSATARGPVAAPTVWAGHLVVCVLLIGASVAAPYFTKDLAASPPFASLMDVQRAVRSEPWVVNAQVHRGQTVISKPDKAETKTTYLGITAYSEDPRVDNAERAAQLAKLALSADPSARGVDSIHVLLVHGYDIGIASAWRSKSYTQTPSEWLAK